MSTAGAMAAGTPLNEFGGPIHWEVPPAQAGEEPDSPFTAMSKHNIMIAANWVRKCVRMIFHGLPSALVEGGDAANYGTKEWIMPEVVVIRQWLHEAGERSMFGQFATEGDGLRNIIHPPSDYVCWVRTLGICFAHTLEQSSWLLLHCEVHFFI